jgi:hypothetical protein
MTPQDPNREAFDRYLEENGLLNYQTKGLTQAQIAERYKAAGVSTQEGWFNQSYGDRPQGQAPAPQAQPAWMQSPLNRPHTGQGLSDQAIAAGATDPYWKNIYNNMGKEGNVVTRRPYEEATRRNALAPDIIKATYKTPEEKQIEQVGYIPTFWQDPKQVAIWHNKIKSAPEGTPLPPGVDAGQIEEAYNYFAYVNKDKPWTEWKQLNADDPGLGFLSSIPRPPIELLNPREAMTYGDPTSAQKGQVNWSDLDEQTRQRTLAAPDFDIAKYPTWMHSQILSDPNFDWERLPDWQRTYYGLSSSPEKMGAVQGALMGAAAGPVGIVVGGGLGAGLGYIAYKSGYDTTKDFWEQGNTTAKIFGALNWAAEQAEKTLGLMKQVEGSIKEPEQFGTVQEIFQNLGAAWEAGGVYGESLPAVFGGKDVVLGRAEAVGLPRIYQLLKDARQKIIDGQAPRQVWAEAQSSGVGAQMGDMLVQATVDPLNFLPASQNKALGKVAKYLNNETAAKALLQTTGLGEAARKYKEMVQTGDVAPGFKYDEMGALSRWVAGVNKKGQVKAGVFGEAGLLDAPVTYENKLKQFANEMTSLTPEARAHQGASLFYENVGALLDMFDDPHQATKYLKSLSNGNMEQFAELGARFANSPEFYTVLPALKDFSAEKIDALAAAWDSTQAKRGLLSRLADVLGEQQGKLLEDLAQRGTKEQDFTRMVDRLNKSKSPMAKSLLQEIQAGNFTPDSLADIVNVFTGKEALPWHPDQWKAMVLDNLGAHFDEWAVQKLGLKPESGFFRFAHMLKSAQSVLLLGGSPGYAITNGLSNMVHRAATGIYGYMTPGQINKWMDRFGVTPARLSEGVGMGGVVEQAAGASKIHTEAISAAGKVEKGVIATMQQNIGKVGKLMPFNKLSSMFESLEGKQGFVIGMKQMWSQSWRRGVGFGKMDNTLTAALKRIDPNAENLIYAAIEAGMNQKEITERIMGKYVGMQARELVNNAAQRAGLSASEAAGMLEKIGVLDTLDVYLKNADTPDKVRTAFAAAMRQAQSNIDQMRGRDIVAKVEHVKQKLDIEGAPAILDVATETTAPYFEAWLDHYARMGKLWNDLQDSVFTPDYQNKIVESVYQQSSTDFRRVNQWQAATWKGVLETTGMIDSEFGRGILQALGDTDQALGDAYKFMLDEKRGFFETYKDNTRTPEANKAFAVLNDKVGKRFENAFAMEQSANTRMRDLFEKYYTDKYGAAAGEVARQMWQDTLDFRGEMLKRLQAQRKTGAPMGKDFFQQTYVPMIVELERIKQVGNAKLREVITGKAKPEAVQAATQAAETRAAETQAARQAHTDTLNQVAAEYGLFDVAHEFGVPSATAAGLPNNQHMLNIVRKYLDMGIKSLNDVTPEAMRTALENRRVEKNRQMPMREIADPAKVAEYDTVHNLARELKDNPETQAAAKIASEALPEPTPEVSEASAKAAKKAKVKADKDPILARIEKTHLADLDSATRDALMYKLWDMKTLVEAGQPGGRIFEGGEFKGSYASTYPDWFGTMKRGKEDVLFALEAMTKGMDKPDQALYRNLKGIAAELLKDDPAMLENFSWAQAMGKADDVLFNWDARVAEIERAVSKFDPATDMIAALDFNEITDLMGRLPDEAQGLKRAYADETYSEFINRVWDEAGRKQAEYDQYQAIAERAVQAEQAVTEAQARSEMLMTRDVLRERFMENFGLDEAQAEAVMAITDGHAKAWAALNESTPEKWYESHVQEVVSGGREPDLQQGQLVRADVYQVERVRQEYVTNKRTDWVKDVANEFGYTRDPREAGYIAPDGKMLDFSGKNKGGTPGQRSLDHRDVEQVLPDEASPDGSATQNMLSFASQTGSIRFSVIGADVYVDCIGTVPTDAQIRAIKKALPGYDTLTFDITDNRGNTVLSGDYPARGASVDRMANEARRIFEGNESGETLQAHYDTLFQLQPVNRTMTPGEYGDYARSLVRAGESDLRLAVGYEDTKAGRRALLDAAHDLDPQMAERVARQTKDMLFQDNVKAKGGVQFMADGKAIIHAFEGGDVSTVVHELGHIFRRDLSGEDVRIAEKWAGAKDGNWTREAEEKFARGFERYLAEGKAPTPQLTKVFENFKTWLVEIYRSITGSAIDVNLTDEIRGVFDRMIAEMPEQIKPEVDLQAVRAKKAELFRPTIDETLFQDADPAMPLGGFDQASGWKADSQTLEQGWQQYIRPLMDALEVEAVDKVNNHRNVNGVVSGLDANTTKQLNAYLNKVRADMASTKLSTMRWGESQRDFAMLNYNRRYGFDKYLEVVYPYQFYYTRSLMTWGMRALDKPSWYSNYARLRMMQNRYENDLPERLRGKFRINAPWLPDWMGDALYIDPLQNLFTPANFLRPFETLSRDKNMQQTEAERILQEWAADGSVPEQEIVQAAQIRSGSVWERALAEAQIRRESEINNPMDFMNTMLGPAWYLTTPYKLATGKGKEITNTPLTNTARALDTVTQGTWMQPIGDIIGLFAKPEEYARQKLNLPEFGEYGDYYIDRQLANMVADGTLVGGQPVTPDQAQMAMIERKGELFDMAQERVKMELAMRVPLAGATYAATHEGAGAAAKAFLPSLFGSGLLPEGELKYRGLKSSWDSAWKQYDKGNKEALTDFFDDHPEYQAYLAKGKDPDEKMRSFLVGQIWDTYTSLGKTDQKQAQMQMGELFKQAFLSSETRSYDSLDLNTLVTWSRALNGMVPKTVETEPILAQPKPEINFFAPEVTEITDKFYQQRSEKFPNYYALQTQYYALPKSERGKFLLRFPELKQYWDWKDGWYEQYPELQPIWKGEVFKTVDTSTWSPQLVQMATMYAVTGDKLPQGMYKLLEQEWLRAGKPYDNFESWLYTSALPGLRNQVASPVITEQGLP